MLVAILLAMLALAPANVLAADECKDDRGLDRCDPQEQAAMLARYGLDNGESLQQQGTQVRRAFFVDGYGRDILAVSFVYERGRDPRVDVRIPVRAGEPATPPATMVISAAQWDSALTKGSYFDRQLTPMEGEDRSICLHSWVIRIEAIDPVRLSQDSYPAGRDEPSVRSKTATSCGPSLAVDYAFELADLAYDLLPWCSALRASNNRDKVQAMTVCARFSGDRIAAAGATYLVENIDTAHDRRASGQDSVFESMLRQVVVSPDPNDEPAPGSDRINRATRDRLISELAQSELYDARYHGIDADHVQIKATQYKREGDGEETRSWRRSITLFASREVNAFRVYRIEATDFALE